MHHDRRAQRHVNGQGALARRRHLPLPLGILRAGNGAFLRPHHGNGRAGRHEVCGHSRSNPGSSLLDDAVWRLHPLQELRLRRERRDTQHDVHILAKPDRLRARAQSGRRGPEPGKLRIEERERIGRGHVWRWGRDRHRFRGREGGPADTGRRRVRGRRSQTEAGTEPPRRARTPQQPSVPRQSAIVFWVEVSQTHRVGA